MNFQNHSAPNVHTTPGDISPRIKSGQASPRKNRISRRVSIQFKKVVNLWDGSEGLVPDNTTNEKPKTIFGQPLELVLLKGGPIPQIIKQLTRFLRNHLEEEGIFRVSGISTKINEIGVLFNGDDKRVDLSSFDCHAVAGAYKKFFRELPEPVFDTNLFEDLLKAKNSDDPPKELQRILSLLPVMNYMIIRYVIKFLKKVSKFSAVNKMAPDNLGIVFGPTLIRSREETETGIPDPHRDPSDAITLLILNYKTVFQQAAEPCPQSLSPGQYGRGRSSTLASSGDSILVRNTPKSPRSRKRSRKTKTTRIDSPRAEGDSPSSSLKTNPRLAHLLD